MPNARHVAPPSAVARIGWLLRRGQHVLLVRGGDRQRLAGGDLLQLPRLAAVGGGEHAGVAGDPEAGLAGAGDLPGLQVAGLGRRHVDAQPAPRGAAVARREDERSPVCVSQPATQACRGSPAATLVSTVMGSCAAEPPGAAAVARRPDPVERDEHAVALVGEGDVGELRLAEARALPGLAAVASCETRRRPRARRRRRARCRRSRRARRRSRRSPSRRASTCSTTVQPAPPSVVASTVPASVTSQPVCASVKATSTPRCGRKNSLALPGRAAVGGDEQDAGLAGGPGVDAGGGRRRVPEGVLRRLRSRRRRSRRGAASDGERGRERRRRSAARLGLTVAPGPPGGVCPRGPRRRRALRRRHRSRRSRGR